jgi:hypothetical protein
MKKVVFACAILLMGTSCDELTHLANQYPDVVNQAVAPTQSEIIAGLKEALTVGIKNTVLQTNKKDGFYGNSLIHIPVPAEADKVMSTLKNLGMNSLVDNFETSLNRAAEEASGQAVDIFVDAITKMTFEDAVGIWKGNDDAATQYLKRTTTSQLEAAFNPITKKAIEATDVTMYWDDIAGVYNNIPFVTQVNPDLNKYVNEKAIDGLFLMVAKQEKDIRENPQARVSAILQKVFGYKG